MLRLASASAMGAAARGSAMRVRAPPLQRMFGGDALSKDDVLARVQKVVKDFEKVDPAKVGAASHFNTDLALDSLDTVELVMALEEEFAVEIEDAEAEKLHTVGEAADFFASHPMAK